MALNFPSSPTNGQTYKQWTWSSSLNAWRINNSLPSFVVSSTAPVSPVNGTQWFDTSDGSVYTYYNDGDSSQWVEGISSTTLDLTTTLAALQTQATSYTNSLARLGSWGAKSGPTAYNTAYKYTWSYGVHSGTGIDATTYSDGIMITETGIYEVATAQRSNGNGNGAICLAVDGSRYTIDGSGRGIWSHDHSTNNGSWAKSYFIGNLNAGEKITAGVPDTTYAGWMTFGSNGYNGYLSVKRLG